ncbi:HIT family protein, partial [Sphaerisporangium corydalis]
APPVPSAPVDSDAGQGEGNWIDLTWTPSFPTDEVSINPGAVHYATLPGYVLVAPKAHVEHVVRDLDEERFLDLMRRIRKIALAVEAAVPCERTYVLSLGSQRGNSHLHWHIVALPPGVPYERQQYHALMAENGIIERTPEEAADLAARIRAELARLPE